MGRCPGPAPLVPAGLAVRLLHRELVMPRRHRPVMLDVVYALFDRVAFAVLSRGSGLCPLPGVACSDGPLQSVPPSPRAAATRRAAPRRPRRSVARPRERRPARRRAAGPVPRSRHRPRYRRCRHPELAASAKSVRPGAQRSISFWVAMNTGPSAPPISTKNTTAAAGSAPATYRPSMPTAWVAMAVVGVACGKRSSSAPGMLTPARQATPKAMNRALTVFWENPLTSPRNLTM